MCWLPMCFFLPRMVSQEISGTSSWEPPNRQLVNNYFVTVETCNEYTCSCTFHGQHVHSKLLFGGIAHLAYASPSFAVRGSFPASVLDGWLYSMMVGWLHDGWLAAWWMAGWLHDVLLLQLASQLIQGVPIWSAWPGIGSKLLPDCLVYIAWLCQLLIIIIIIITF